MNSYLVNQDAKNAINAVFWDVTFARTDVSEKCTGSIIMVDRISELGTPLP
jgi:hypothetical protein